MPRVVHVFRQPERFIAGTVGQPGDRTFYLQATMQAKTVSVSLEKQQVSMLAERLNALLEEIRRQFGAEVPAESPSELVDSDPLLVPIDEEFRVGTMGLGWDAESNCVVVELLEMTEGEVDESVVLDDAEEGPDALRVFLKPAVAKAFAERAELVVNAGRKPCPLCGEPLEPDGHVCPRLNGYRRLSEDAEE
ncbi:MAG: DUF3090 domain-containing protein [Sciscionella sp.]|nr:DUF3090 domain-containing protein [Sciscionella sp.]